MLTVKCVTGAGDYWSRWCSQAGKVTIKATARIGTTENSFLFHLILLIILKCKSIIKMNKHLMVLLHKMFYLK